MSTIPIDHRSAATVRLLACAIAGSSLFVVAVLVQSFTRAGFDPRVHALSMLALGDLGWIQTLTFVLSGALILASVTGFRRALSPGRGRIWGPVLIGLFGVGLIWGGLFPTDAGLGFPDGAPAGIPEPTVIGTLHNLSPTLVAVSLVAACIVLARRFAGMKRWGWMAYCIATPVAYLLLGFVAFPLGDFRWVLAGGAIIWVWPAVIAWDLIREVRGGIPAASARSHEQAAA